MKDLKEKFEKYERNARPWFESLDLHEPEGLDLVKVAAHFKEMARAYYDDSLHFYEKEEYVNALAALEYAEGWFDAGVALGIFVKPKD